MTTLVVHGGRPLRGRLRVPGDKSISHRALMLGALADGTSVVRGLSTGDDVAHTRAAVVAMGADVNGERVTGGRDGLHAPGAPLEVGNSGTTIRLLAGMCATFPWTTALTGDDSIAVRPMDRVADPLRRMGARVELRDDRYPPVEVTGGDLRGIDYTVPVASAQVKSAVLLAGLAADGETVVREPVPTRAHTEELLALCGADIDARDGVVRVRRSPLKPFELDVPADPSQAAFWVVAATIVPDSDLVLEDVYVGPARAGFVDVLRRMGADIEVVETGARVADLRVRSAALRGTDVDAAEIPGLDEVPALAVAAALAEGTTTFRDVGELRVKESDRIATVTSELAALTGRVEPHADSLVVHGGGRLQGATVRSHGDHRIAMAMAVAGLAADGETTVEGWDVVATSYPHFAEDLHACGS